MANLYPQQPGDGLNTIDLRNPLNQAHPLNQGKTAWWLTLPTYNGGRVWNDICAGHNNGTLNTMLSGITPTGWVSQSRPGGFGSVFFDGLSGNVTCGTGLNVGGGDVTVAIWFKTSYSGFTPSGTGHIAGLIGKNSTNATTGRFGILLTSSGAVQGLYQSASGATHQSTAISGVNDANWHHAAWVISRSLGSGYLYVDGKLRNGVTINSNSGFFVSNGLTFSIGEYPGASTPSNCFAGNLDDGVMYNRGLSSAEIYQMFTAGPFGYPGVLNRLG